MSADTNGFSEKKKQKKKQKKKKQGKENENRMPNSADPDETALTVCTGI